MKPLPPIFAMCCLQGDRWLAVAPAEHEIRARTFDRTVADLVVSQVLRNPSRTEARWCVISDRPLCQVPPIFPVDAKSR
jgi:hypothetical protein